jgi:putative MATE family efflux protein
MMNAPVLDEATTYLQICSIGFLFILGFNVCAAALRAVGNSKVPLICIACTCVINIALTLIFVAVLGLGVFGAALSTVFSQAASFFISLMFVLRERELFGIKLSALYIKFAHLRDILRFGIPIAVQMSIASFSWLMVTYLVNQYGQFASAASGIAGRIRDLCLLFLVAMMNASAGMIAQCVGANDHERARKVMYTAMAVSVSIAVLLIAVVQFAAPFLVGLFTNEAETAVIAVQNLRIEIIGQLFYASFVIYHSIALGSGHTWFVFFSSFTNCILARVVLTLILNYFFGLPGIFWACMIAPFASVPLGLWYERSNRWQLPPRKKAKVKGAV